MWLRSSDGLEGEVDLSGELPGGVFELLRDARYFATFTLEDTLAWPNGADFAPEFLLDLVRAANRTHPVGSPPVYRPGAGQRS